jgi:hypothetical protein
MRVFIFDQVNTIDGFVHTPFQPCETRKPLRYLSAEAEILNHRG